MEKERHTAAERCVRSLFFRAQRPLGCFFLSLTLSILVVVSLLFAPFSPLQRSQRASSSSLARAQGRIHAADLSLVADPTQSEHEQAVSLAIDRSAAFVAAHRPPLAEDGKVSIPDEFTLPYEPLLDIVSRWSPDDPEIPADFEERLAHFDFGNPEERLLAEQFRDAEVPFKLYNVSDVQEVARKWSDVYLKENLRQIAHRAHTERSRNNHFMFWSYKGMRGGALRGKNAFVPPTEIVSNMHFDDWLPLARAADRDRLSNASEHLYFMAGAEAHEHGKTFISRDLRMFSTEKDNFWVTNVAANKGIQCRFGMRGVIAEAHYDSGKNMVAMLRGEKRYILTPPRTCSQLGIISDVRHPSYRHSVIDWSDLEQAKQHHFEAVPAIDTVVRAGEVLYIPSFWFHYIISLKYSIQCNSRSGFPKDRKGQNDIQKCFGIGS